MQATGFSCADVWLATVSATSGRCEDRTVAAAATVPWQRRGRPLLPFVAVAGAAAAAMLVAGDHVAGTGLPTTYSGVTRGAEAVDLLAGLSLLAAAFAAALEGSATVLGAL